MNLSPTRPLENNTYIRTYTPTHSTMNSSSSSSKFEAGSLGGMEDIEDMLAGAPAGFRLPISASVGVKPKKKNKQPSPIQHFLTPLPSPKIPGTQVLYIFKFIW